MYQSIEYLRSEYASIKQKDANDLVVSRGIRITSWEMDYGSVIIELDKKYSI